MNAGDTFRLSSSETSWRPYIVVSNPTVDPNSVLIVSLVLSTSDYGEQDRACVLLAGEHPICPTESCIGYHWAKNVNISGLQNGVRTREVSIEDPLDEKLLFRVRLGFFRSVHSKPKHRDILLAQGFEAEYRPGDV